MRILGIISGEYGKRHIDNIRKHGPAGWEIEVWQAPTHFPLVIDYPEDYIPERLSPADLILSFAEHRGVRRTATRPGYSQRGKRSYRSHRQ